MIRGVMVTETNLASKQIVVYPTALLVSAPGRVAPTVWSHPLASSKFY